MTCSRQVWVALVLMAAACGGAVNGDGSGGGPPAGGNGGAVSVGGDARADAGGRVPKKHRPAGSACPRERGPGWWTAPAECTPGTTGLECAQDLQCSAGDNGRCIPWYLSCTSDCSYDDCYDDSYCAAKVPCHCRASASEWRANTCQTTSNCRVDGDCGPGGYCSPSDVDTTCICVSPGFCDGSCAPSTCACGDSCGHGYYCHTLDDECIDDSDCAPAGPCSFDTASRHWLCARCVIPP
jgi:hypothetical protein